MGTTVCCSIAGVVYIISTVASYYITVPRRPCTFGRRLITLSVLFIYGHVGCYCVLENNCCIFIFYVFNFFLPHFSNFLYAKFPKIRHLSVSEDNGSGDYANKKERVTGHD